MGEYGVSLSLLIRSVVFSRLNLLGGGASSLILWEKSLALFCVT
jgi:hypothetical protein